MPKASISQHRQTTFLFLGLLLLGLITTLALSLSGTYVWDDVFLVQHNAQLTSSQGWRDVFLHGTWQGAMGREGQAYHPIAMLSFWLETQLFGKQLVISRIVNILVHMSVTLCVFLLLLRWLNDRLAAWWGGLFFAFHPGMTEPIMWLTGRHDTLGVLFALLACLCWPTTQEDVEHGPRYLWIRAAGAGLLSMAAFLCKEIHVVMPSLFAIFMLWNPNNIERKSWHWGWLLMPTVGVGSVFLIRASIGISSSTALVESSLWSHLHHYTSIVWHYLWHALTLQNGLTIASYSPLPVWYTLTLLGVLLLTIVWLFWLWFRQNTYAGGALFGLGWFLICLSPYTVSVPTLKLLGNRYLYFPAVGLCVLIGLAVNGLRKHASARSLWLVGSVGSLLLLYAGVTLQQESKHWKDALSLYGADLQRRPKDGHILYHYGHAVRMKKGCKGALEYFAAATRYAPVYGRAWRNYAGCLINLHRHTRALSAAKRALELLPHEPSSYYNLGVAFVRLGRFQESLKVVQRGQKRFPRYRSLLRLLFQLQRYLATHPKQRPPSSLPTTNTSQ